MGVNRAGTQDTYKEVEFHGRKLPKAKNPGIKKIIVVQTAGSAALTLFSATTAALIYSSGTMASSYGGIIPQVVASAIMAKVLSRMIPARVIDLINAGVISTIYGVTTGASCAQVSALAATLFCGFTSGLSLKRYHWPTKTEQRVAAITPLVIPTVVAYTAGVGAYGLIAGVAATIFGRYISSGLVKVEE